MDDGATGRVDLHGDLLHAWASWARDPAAPVAEWLWLGAPAGVAVDFKLDGLLEPVPLEEPIPLEQLASDFDTFSNYSGVEDDPGAVDILNGYIDRGWLKEFGSLEELSDFVGGEPILNKFACICKEQSGRHRQASHHYGCETLVRHCSKQKTIQVSLAKADRSLR